ncbi:MAG: hypothetical protein JRJ56_06180 [Deltaproteobacteria bacterium]|nr:hypothetical protein [Deltaproteobacteria bacterium]
MLKIVCQHCGARCRAAAAKVPSRGARVCCPACRRIFFFRPPRPAAVKLAAWRKKTGAAAARFRSAIWNRGRLAGRRLLVFAAGNRLAITVSLALLFQLFLAGFWCSHRPAPAPIISARITLKPAVVSKELLHRVVAEIKNHQLVGDAAVSQEKEQFFLTLLVNRAAPPAWASRLGRQFLQALNRVAIQRPTGYHFHLHVYYPDGREISQATVF